VLGKGKDGAKAQTSKLNLLPFSMLGFQSNQATLCRSKRILNQCPVVVRAHVSRARQQTRKQNGNEESLGKQSWQCRKRARCAEEQ